MTDPQLTARTLARQAAGQIGRNLELEVESAACEECSHMRQGFGPEAICWPHYQKFRAWRESECRRLDAEGVPVPVEERAT